MGHDDNKRHAESLPSANSDDDAEGPIAIISVSCRFPGSNSPEEYWETLKTCGNAPLRNSDDDISQRNIPEDLKKNVNFLKYPVEEFDAQFFNIALNKAVYIDPQQRLLLEMSWEALEKASIDPQSLKGTATGVFVGAWSADYDKILASSSLAGTREFHWGYISTSYGAMSSHIAHILGLHGRHSTIDRGSASSTFCLHQACRSLWRHESNLVIAAGVNLIFLSKSGEMTCKRAEGCCVVILKRLEDAVAQKDDILGVIRGVGLCMDGTDLKFGQVSSVSQEKAMRSALNRAELTPQQISYIELQQDNEESEEEQAVHSVYGNYRGTSDLLIDCVAHRIGNAESAAGFAALVKILMCMQHESIPDVLDEWPKITDKKRYAAINSYGFAGECAHLILEEPPETRGKWRGENKSDGECHILTFSAKSANALEKLKENYQEFFDRTEENIADICYTANACRAQLPFRVAVWGTEINELNAQLRAKKFLQGKCSAQTPKIAFLFDSHDNFKFKALSRQFYQSNADFRQAIENCSTLFNEFAKCEFLFKDLLWNENIAQDEKENFILPLNFCVQYCLVELYKSFGIQADFVLGYSTGEFAAACTAGILNLEQTMKCIIEINKTLSTLPKLTTVSVKASRTLSEKLLEFYFEENPKFDRSVLEISAIQSSELTVIAGNAKNINGFMKLCLEEGVEVRILNGSSFTFHCSNIPTEITEKLLNALQNKFGTVSEIPFISGITGEVVAKKGSPLTDTYWGDFSTGVVNFSQAIKNLWYRQGCRIFLDIGTSATLLRMSMTNISQKEAAASTCLSSLKHGESNRTNTAAVLSKLFVAGVDIKWKDWDLNLANRRKVQIPVYPFQREKLWPA